jgi:phosphate transport system protein
LNINTQLERIGDIAVNIAERVAALQAYLEFLRASQLTEMADIAKIMVRDGLDAFIQSDAELAGRVLASDDVVDSLNRSIFQRLVREMQADHARIAPAAHMLILSRHIERVADHATNIAEDVVFVVEARLVKHNASV